jgi:hypothetical protein
MRGKRTDEWREEGVEAYVSVFRVVHDVLQLLWKEAWIDGVQHEARGGNSIVDLEVPVAVLGQGRDAVSFPQAKTPEGVGEPLGSFSDLAVIRTMHPTLRVA